MERTNPTAVAEPAPGGATDRSLLRRVRGGNEDAATAIYLRYARRLEALARARTPNDLARRVDAEDIVQSVFSSFFRGVGKGYYDVPEGEELWKLLLVIALNKIRATGAYHRAAKRDVRVTAGGNALQGGNAPADADSAAEATLQLVIDEMLDGMPPAQREVVSLRIEGHEVGEIAARTQRSKRTVERVLQDFRNRLADALRPGD